VQRFWTWCKREHLPRADSNLDLILSKDRASGPLGQFRMWRRRDRHYLGGPRYSIRPTRTNIEIGKGGWRDNDGAGSFFDVRF